MKFGFEGHDALGIPKKGTVEAESEAEAAETLRKQGVFALRLDADGEIQKPVLNHPTTVSPNDSPAAALDQWMTDGGRPEKEKKWVSPSATPSVVESRQEAMQPQKSIGEFLGVQPRHEPQQVKTEKQAAKEAKIENLDVFGRAIHTWAETVHAAKKYHLNVEDLRPAAQVLLAQVLREEYDRRMAEKSFVGRVLAAIKEDMANSGYNAAEAASKRKKKSGKRK